MMKWLSLKNILLIFVALAFLGSAFLVFRPSPNNNQQISSPRDNASPRVFDFRIQGDRLISGESSIRVKQGDVVTLKVTADAEDELHLHGYDKSLELAPGKTAETTFTADMSGRFEAELHKSEAPVFALEVYPE